MILSTDISIHDNEIHHNADGAIAWGDWFTKEGTSTSEGFSDGITIEDNYIHNNMGGVFFFMTEVFEPIILAFCCNY